MLVDFFDRQVRDLFPNCAAGCGTDGGYHFCLGCIDEYDGFGAGGFDSHCRIFANRRNQNRTLRFRLPDLSLTAPLATFGFCNEKTSTKGVGGLTCAVRGKVDAG